MSKIFRRSSCQKASDGTDGDQRRRYRTRFDKANGACHFRGRSIIAPPLSIFSASLVASRGHGSLRGRKQSAATSGSKYGRRDVHSGLA
jgi:hypothetical protein